MSSPSEIAGSYLENYWQDFALPVNPEAIAMASGVVIKPIEDIGLAALAGLSGAYKPNNGSPTIYINRNEGLTRQRFTCAHELGHYALRHVGDQLDRISGFTIGQLDYRETEANAFAAALLMPKWSVEALIIDQNIRNVEMLAEMFGVSQNAMRFRLINLGWLGQ